MSLLSFLQPGALPSLFPQNAGRAPLKPAVQEQPAPNGKAPSLSETGKSPVGQGSALSSRVGRLADATAGMAKNLLTDLVKNLFGDAQGATISFDSASLSASSAMAAMVQRDSNGSAAGFRLEDNSSFVGKGQITTADGHTFNFEVEVHYQLTMEAAVATHTGSSAAADSAAPQATAAAPVPAAQHQALRFPGSLADLLNLFGQGDLQGSFQVPGKDGESPNDGKLLMRLLERIAQPQDTYARPANNPATTSAA